MGGVGSGRWHAHEKAPTLESALRLPALLLGRPRGSEIAWTRRGRTVGAASCTLQHDPAGVPIAATIQYSARHTAQHVDVVRRRTAAGSWQLLWRCACGRTVRSLYLPRRGDRFACRHCYGLAYYGCQAHDKNARRRLALIERHIARCRAMLAHADRRLA